jgi:hypothetical protein
MQLQSNPIRLILNRPIVLTLYIDSKSLYECLVRLGSTTEKRLMVDIMYLRQVYERREIIEVVWIEGRYNLADCMTKDRGKCRSSLKNVIDTNKLDIAEGMIGWVERPKDQPL